MIQQSLFVRVFFYFQCEFMFYMNLHDLLHTRAERRNKQTNKQKEKKPGETNERERERRKQADVSDSIVEIGRAYSLY